MDLAVWMLWIIISKEPFHTMSEGLLSMGVTSFLPTTLTSSYEQLLAVTENIGARYQEAVEPRFVESISKGLISQRNTRELKTLPT